MDLLELQTRDSRLRLHEVNHVVLRRAQALASKDRVLLEMALNRRLSRRQIAGLLGIEAGTVCRRIQRLVSRLYDPLVVALLERPGRLPEEFRQMGIEYFVQKRTIEELADLHRVSKSQVQKMIHYVRGWAG